MTAHFQETTPKTYLIDDLQELIDHPLPNLSRLTCGELQEITAAIKVAQEIHQTATTRHTIVERDLLASLRLVVGSLTVVNLHSNMHTHLTTIISDLEARQAAIAKTTDNLVYDGYGERK
jgi:phosphoribosylaminoimidazole carboxylase (NCAIR synthetase)